MSQTMQSNQSGYTDLAFSASRKCQGKQVAASAVPLQGSAKGEDSKWLYHTYLLTCPKVRRNTSDCMMPTHSGSGGYILGIPKLAGVKNAEITFLLLRS